jgi:hydroxyacylglutathione hydrolase
LSVKPLYKPKTFKHLLVVSMSDSLFIATLPSGPYATNAYVIGCEKTQKAAIIDPSPNSCAQVSETLKSKSFTPVCIILTHSHWDHIADVGPLLQEYPHLQVFVQEEDLPNLASPGKDGLPFSIFILPQQADTLLHDGDVIQVGQTKWRVIHTPGHSPGSICLYCQEEGVLFSGDTLFKRSIGNLSFPTSQPDRMWPSLKKLEALPKETRVFPGHGEATTIGQESWLARAEKIFG